MEVAGRIIFDVWNGSFYFLYDESTVVGFLFINAWNISMAIDFLLLLSFEIDTLFEFFDNVSQKERQSFS